MSEPTSEYMVHVKEEIYLISLVLADLSGVSLVDFVERAIAREALNALEAHVGSNRDIHIS